MFRLKLVLPSPATAFSALPCASLRAQAARGDGPNGADAVVAHGKYLTGQVVARTRMERIEAKLLPNPELIARMAHAVLFGHTFDRGATVHRTGYHLITPIAGRPADSSAVTRERLGPSVDREATGRRAMSADHRAQDRERKLFLGCAPLV